MKHDPFDRRGYIYVKVDGQSGHYCKKVILNIYHVEKKIPRKLTKENIKSTMILIRVRVFMVFRSGSSFVHVYRMSAVFS